MCFIVLQDVRKQYKIDNMFPLVQNTQQKHCVNLKKRCVISSKYKLIFLKLIKLIMI